MKTKVVLLLVAMVITMSVMTQTTNATACNKNSCDCIKVCCCDCSKNECFLIKDGGWKFNRTGILLFFETTDYKTGIRGLRQVLSGEDASFLEKGLKKALSNGQMVSKIEIIIDDNNGETDQIVVYLKDARGDLSYSIYWHDARVFAKNKNCLRVERDDDYGNYLITTPNSSGYFSISTFDSYRCADLKGFISYFGAQVHDNCFCRCDCDCGSCCHHKCCDDD